ncbi:MAG: hypothetical protein HY084_04865 [Gemmatimonadetes bacterium]|nr:hypothetical protein [Gemmatimonadota bacterium]
MAVPMLALCTTVASGQISPGPLARAHADLEGAGNCVKCHGLRKEPMAQLCLACHKDVAWSIDRGRGLHAKEAKPGAKTCASCHPDHAGVKFALVAWPEGSAAKFDHTRAGWSLEGKHANVKCEKCHTNAFRVSPAASLTARKDHAPGWLGLETRCASCHRADDVHKNSLGESCDKCHDAKGWKPAPKFDHDKSDYPLTGKHADVECDKCHLATRLKVQPNAEGKLEPLFKPVSHKECSDCHADPHKGRLSPKCGDCHVTRGFLVIDRKEFDHGRTRYALEGKHREVKCEACHGPSLKKNPPFATCGSCHADAHQGEGTLAGKPADCAACHTVGGFAPSTFTVARHRSARFVLHGKHEAVKCAQCHTAVPARAATRGATPALEPATAALARSAKVVRLRVAFANCASCHADAHGGQTAASLGKGTCEACHDDAGWKPSTFSAARHAALKLPLEGRHAAVPCAACHAASRRGLPPLAHASLGTAKVALSLNETACESCHADPHAGRYSTAGARAQATGCRGCHDATAFRPSTITTAAHAAFAFPLDGAHRATPCVACHDEMKAPAATSSLIAAPLRMAALPFVQHRDRCATCHESPHGDQFAARKDQGACEGCHGAAGWAPATRFDHTRDASFALTGAHEKTPCAGCHRRDPKGRVLYRPLSGACESCHVKAPSRRTT